MEVFKDSEVMMVSHWQGDKLLPTLWEASGTAIRLGGKVGQAGA